MVHGCNRFALECLLKKGDGFSQKRVHSHRELELPLLGTIPVSASITENVCIQVNEKTTPKESQFSNAVIVTVVYCRINTYNSLHRFLAQIS